MRMTLETELKLQEIFWVQCLYKREEENWIEQGEKPTCPANPVTASPNERITFRVASHWVKMAGSLHHWMWAMEGREAISAGANTQHPLLMCLYYQCLYQDSMAHLFFVEKNSFLKSLTIFCWYSVTIMLPVYI